MLRLSLLVAIAICIVGSALPAAAQRRRRYPPPKARAPRPFRPTSASSLDRIARRLLRRGDVRRAISVLRRMLGRRRLRWGVRHDRTLHTARRLGLALYTAGRYARAERLFRMLLEARRDGSPLPRAQAVRDLAGVLLEKGDYDAAEQLYREGLTLLEKGGVGDSRLAAALSDLGGLYCERRAYREARPHLERALKLLRGARRTTTESYAATLNNLALVRQEDGDIGAAMRLLEKALSLHKARKTEPLARVQTLSNLALLAHRRGYYKSAEARLREVLAIQKRDLLEAHPAIATTLLNLGWMALAQQQPARALVPVEKGLALRQKTLELIVAQGSEQQRQAYLRKLSSEKDFVLSFYFAHQVPRVARLALTTVLRRKGRVIDALSRASQARHGRVSGSQARLWRSLKRTRAAIAALVLRRRRSRSTERLRRLLRRARYLERQLVSAAPHDGLQAAAVSFERVQAALPRKAALVEIVWYRPFRPQAHTERDRWAKPRYAAAIVLPEGDPRWLDLGSAEAIDQAVARLRRALDPRRSVDFVRARARRAFGKIIAPLKRWTQRSKLLIIAPDGALNLLPFAALVDDTGRYLAEGQPFTLVTGGRELLRWRSNMPARSPAVVVAAPSFGSLDDKPLRRRARSPQRRSSALGDHRFSPLPQSANEGATLSRLLPGARLLSGAAATEQAFKKLLGPRILHVATHGFFLPDQGLDRELLLATGAVPLASISGGVRIVENPLLRSGIALAGANRLDESDEDGILTALEMSGLNLWGTRLVVLSACDTGMGEVQNGEGVYGLRRALVIAGAQSHLLSLWKVEDTATRRLMEHFYGRLRAGDGRAAALRRAQMHLMRDSAYQHPFFWAAFVPSGNPAPIEWTVTKPTRSSTKPQRPATRHREHRADATRARRSGFSAARGDRSVSLPRLKAFHGVE